MKYTDTLISKLERELLSKTTSAAVKIHRLRVATKKLRSRWRMCREEIRPRRYRREVARLRAVSRHFGEPRDNAVMLHHLKQLRVEAADAENLKQAQMQLVCRPRLKNTTNQWRELVLEIRSSADRLTTRAPGRRTLKKQVKRSLLKNRQHLARCLRQPHHPAKLHRWRRQAKHLLYQIEFLNSLGASYSSRSLLTLRTLAEDLGTAHDLTRLYQFLRQHKFSQAVLSDTQTRLYQVERQSLREGQRLKLT